jgi:hypothetical protein
MQLINCSFDHDTKNPTTVLYDEKEVIQIYLLEVIIIGTFSRQMLVLPATIGIVKGEWSNNLHGGLSCWSYELHRFYLGVGPLLMRCYWYGWRIPSTYWMRWVTSVNKSLTFHSLYQTNNLEQEWTIRRPHLIRSAAWCTPSSTSRKTLCPSSIVDLSLQISSLWREVLS